MIDYLLAVIALAVLALLTSRAARIWIDTRTLGWRLPRCLVWAIVGAIAPSSYWWDARVQALDAEAQTQFLRAETPMLGIDRPDALTCPLCGANVPGAWTVDAEGRPVVAPGPVECPMCDFRLDACRHCAHFLPGPPQGWARSAWATTDMTSGRCGFYKTLQPVEGAVDSDMAGRLRQRGYDQIRAPRPILDSFLPPESCRAFKPDRRRLKMGGVQWPDPRRAAWIRMEGENAQAHQHPE